MNCTHERLKCTNNVLSCLICGAVLPLDVLTCNKSTPADKPREGPPKPARRGRKSKAD